LNHTACGRVVYYKVVTKQALTITGYRASHRSAQNFFRPMLPLQNLVTSVQRQKLQLKLGAEKIRELNCYTKP
jgi:hypothetical protein